jgi:hypothetical protein
VEILQFVSPPAAEEQHGLRVLRGDRIFGPLDRRGLKRLCAEGRIAGDDLVCAVRGPWMTVADFLAPPRAPEMAEEVAEPETEPEFEYVPLRWYHVYSDEVDVRQVDQWYVRVHGIHSAPLTRRQVRALFYAQEITGRTVARHVTWQPEAWQPIDSIPELAEMLRTWDTR